MLLWGLTQLLSNTLGIAAIHLEFVFTNFYTRRKWQQFLSLDSVHLHQAIRFLRAEHLQIVFVPVIFVFFDGLYMYNIFNTYIYIFMYMCFWVLYMIMISICSYSVLWRYMLDWWHQFKYRQPVNNNDFNFGQSCMGPFLLYPILPRSTEERGSFPFAV